MFMNIPAGVTITETERKRSTQFDIAVEHGELNAMLFPASASYERRTLNILSIETDPKFTQRGIGKLLLRTSLELAHERQADEITSFMITRECIHAMRSVFGDEAMTIEQLGTFGDEDEYNFDAKAILHYEVPQLDNRSASA